MDRGCTGDPPGRPYGLVCIEVTVVTHIDGIQR